MRLTEAVIEAVDWSKIEVLRGTGTDLAASLTEFVQADTSERASELWWGLEGAAFAQNTIYAAAEPTVSVMMAALAGRPPAFLRPWITEVLRFILSGESDVDPSLSERCREAAQQGVWLLVAEVGDAEEPDYKEAVLEVLALIDPALTGVVRARLGIDSS